MSMDKYKNILLISFNVGFKENLRDCLQERYKVFAVTEVLPTLSDFCTDKNIDVIILDLLRHRPQIEGRIRTILETDIKKMIVLENAKELYMNTDMQSPFSVYKKIYPKNRISKHIIKFENQIQEKVKNSTIFRVAEVYGPHINFGLVHNLMNHNSITLLDGVRDLIYEGDVIHAIEVALETDAIGIYDISSGEPVKVNDMLEMVKKFRDTDIKVNWKGEEDIQYNCDNFKYFKWEPLIPLECGLKTTKKLKKDGNNV